MAGRDPYLTRGAPAGAGRYDGVGPGGKVARGTASKASCCFGDENDEANLPKSQTIARTGQLPGERTPLMDDYKTGRGGGSGFAGGGFGGTMPLDLQTIARMRQTPRQTLEFHAKTMMALVLVPFSIFFLNATVFGFPNRTAYVWTAFAHLVMVFSLAFGGVLISVYFWEGRQRWYYLYMGCLGIIAVGMGVTAGNRLYERDMAEHWLQGSRVRYDNMTATHMAASVPDAGIIGFAEDTRVDLRRVLGYRPQGTSTTYCVAPILDDSQGNEEFVDNWGDVQFWAVGVDCCGSHWGFWCDDAQNPGTARNTVVISGIYSPWAMERYEVFQKAAHNAAAFYHLTTPKSPVFVRWVQSVSTAQHGFGDAALRLFLMCLLYLIVSVLMAGALHWSGPIRPMKKPDALGP